MKYKVYMKQMTKFEEAEIEANSEKEAIEMYKMLIGDTVFSIDYVDSEPGDVVFKVKKI